MYRYGTRFMASAVLVLLLPQGGAMADERATAPQAGTYQGEIWVNAASPGCRDQKNYAAIASMSFPGLSGANWYLRSLEVGPNSAIVSVQTLAVKSGKGTTSPSGNLTWTGEGVGNTWSETGTFSATVTEIGTHAFALQLKESYQGCSEEDIYIPLARIGANQ